MITLTSFQVMAVLLQVPNLRNKDYKELKAYSAELKYVKELKNHYKKKNKILNDLRKHSTFLIKEQKNFIKNKNLYMNKMKQFQNPKKRKRPNKRVGDLKISIYVSKIRQILKERPFLKNCYQKTLKITPFFIQGITSGLFKISKRGRIIDFKFISPQNKGIHSKNIINCLSFHLKKMVFPFPPHKRPIRILQTFKFKISR
jgi:hypothetical protein